MYNITLEESNNYLSLFFVFPLVITLIVLFILYTKHKKITKRNMFNIFLVFVISVLLSSTGITYLENSIASSNRATIEKETGLKNFKTINSRIICAPNTKTDMALVSWKDESILGKESYKVGVATITKSGSSCKISVKVAGVESNTNMILQ